MRMSVLIQLFDSGMFINVFILFPWIGWFAYSSTYESFFRFFQSSTMSGVAGHWTHPLGEAPRRVFTVSEDQGLERRVTSAPNHHPGYSKATILELAMRWTLADEKVLDEPLYGLVCLIQSIIGRQVGKHEMVHCWNDVFTKI